MIRPTAGRILVKVLPEERPSPNLESIILVEKKKHFEGMKRGEVLAVGSGVRMVGVGDVVVFSGDAGFTMDFDPLGGVEGIGDERTQRWLREGDCLAVEEAIV